MIDNYLIVDKKILPAYYEKVVEARNLLESHQCHSVKEATMRVGISRNTYYKYKDYVFTPSEEFGRRFTISIRLEDIPGSLSNILNHLSESNASIITIHQEIPINNNALVIITLDAKHMSISIDELIRSIKELNNIHDVSLLAIE